MVDSYCKGVSKSSWPCAFLSGNRCCYGVSLDEVSSADVIGIDVGIGSDDIGYANVSCDARSGIIECPYLSAIGVMMSYKATIDSISDAVTGFV
jgi:hypothetical protein